MESTTEATSVQVYRQEEVISQAELASKLLAVDAVETPKRSVEKAKSKYFYHWLRIKPEKLESLTGLKRLGRADRNVGCVIVHMDYQEPLILGRSVEEMTHDKWVELFRELSVFKDVYLRLGLNADEVSLVSWKTNAKCYFSRNKFGSSHWQFLRLMEEHPHLKVAVLSLSALVAAAETAEKEVQGRCEPSDESVHYLSAHPSIEAG